MRGLSPPGLRQKAYQFIIENPPSTCQQLKDHKATKDLSFAVTSGIFGSTSSSVHKKTEIGRIKDQFEELPELMKNH